MQSHNHASHTGYTLRAQQILLRPFLVVAQRIPAHFLKMSLGSYDWNSHISYYYEHKSKSAKMPAWQGHYKVPSLSDEPLASHGCQDSQLSSGMWAWDAVCAPGGAPHHAHTAPQGQEVAPHHGDSVRNSVCGICEAWRRQRAQGKIEGERGKGDWIHTSYMHVCMLKKTLKRKVLSSGKQVDFRWLKTEPSQTYSPR